MPRIYENIIRPRVDFIENAAFHLIGRTVLKVSASDIYIEYRISREYHLALL